MSPGPEEEEAGPGLGSARGPDQDAPGLAREAVGARVTAPSHPLRVPGATVRGPRRLGNGPGARQPPPGAPPVSRATAARPGPAISPSPVPLATVGRPRPRAARSSRAPVGSLRGRCSKCKACLPRDPPSARSLHGLHRPALQVRGTPPSPGPLRLSLEARWAPRKDQRVCVSEGGWGPPFENHPILRVQVLSPQVEDAEVGGAWEPTAPYPHAHRRNGLTLEKAPGP